MISVLDLGVIEYGAALQLQERLVELRKAGSIGDVLLLLEHTPVITLGRNAKEGNIVVSHEMLAKRGVEVFEINRGGDVTFHGPGQLVAYPIFNILQFTPKLGAVDFVRRLEEVLMRVCGEYRVETQRIKGMTGVWTFATEPPKPAEREMERDWKAEKIEANNPTQAKSALGWGTTPLKPTTGLSGPPMRTWTERKVAAIGVHISRGVTSHGFALNVATDLGYFQMIVPCGLTKPVTSIANETGEKPAMEEVKHRAARAFGELFGQQVLWLESLDDLMATVAPQPEDTPAKAPEELRRMRGEDTHRG